MKRIVFPLLLLLAVNFASFAQSQYETLPDNEGKIYKGIISRDLLQKDTAFKWYAENLKGYTPNPSGLASFKKNVDSINVIVFMGTWCEDSHNIVPKFFAFADAAGLSEDRISVIGVDRSKKTLGRLSEALNITNVPTIIVMKKGKELGRV